MVQSKLLTPLRQLNARQLSRCGQLLPCLATAKNKELIPLYQCLVSYAPEFTSADLAKKQVAKKMGISTKALAYRSSELQQALAQCLLVDALLADPLEQQLGLMQLWHNLDLPKHYAAAARKARSILTDSPSCDWSLLRQEYSYYELEERHSAAYTRGHRPELQAAADALDVAYLAEKLHYLVEMTNARQVLNIPYQLAFATEVKQWAKQADFQAYPVIRIYEQTLTLLEHPENPATFLILRELLQAHETELAEGLRQDIYACLLNHCTKRITQFHDTAYYAHFLELNEYLIARGELLEGGFLVPWRYNNLITVGLRTGRLAWAQDFLETYRSALPPDFRENIYQYNLAHLRYYQQDYDTAQLILNQLDLRDHLLAVAAKNLLAKIYYETDQIELLLTFLEAYRIYIYRQVAAKARLKEQVRNFIEFVRKMARLPPADRAGKAALAAQLPAAAIMLEHEWVKAKLEE